MRSPSIMMKRIDSLNKLLSGTEDGNVTCITQNALTIDKMQWKGKKGTAILIPHYNGKIVISMDGGNTWDYFFQGDNYSSTEANANLMDELSLELTKDRQVYVVSRSELKHKLNFQYLIDLKGNLLKKWQKDIIATWCSHGTERLPDNRIMYSSSNGQYRNNALIGITITHTPDEWNMKQLYTGGGCGYTDVCWDKKDKSILYIAECGPILDGKFLDTPSFFIGGNDPERLSIRMFKFSETYLNKALPKAPSEMIPWMGRVRQSKP